VLTNSAITRSASTRNFFLVSAGITIGILWWTYSISFYPQRALSASFFHLFTTLDQSGASGLLLIMVGAIFIARPSWLRRVALGFSDHANAIALATAVALCAGTVFVYDNHPLSMDEYAAYFQSQVFAAGHLAGRFPTPLIDWVLPPAFQNYFLTISHTTGAVASQYWPSFSLLLTPFTWLGIAWACNPVISALTVLVVHRLALRLFADREAAGFAVLLTLASPVFLADGISYYSMPAHLLANCLYALLLLDPTPRRAVLAGVIGSIALTLHNPVPHFLFAVPWFLWVARQPHAGRLMLCLCGGYLPLCLLLGVGWFEFLHSLRDADSGAAPHSFIDNRSDVLTSTFSLPTPDLIYARLVGLAKVWVWAVPGIMILAGAGAWKLRHDPRCRLFVASTLATLLGYLLVPVDQGHGWGFRYFHSAWMVLPLLAAGALTRKPTATAAGEGFATEDMRAFVTACALLCLIAANGQRAQQIHQYIADDLDSIPRYENNERQILFINPAGFYTLDLVQNDPWLRGNRVIMMSHGWKEDRTLISAQFPQMRRVVEGPHGSVWVNDSGHVARR
jgi:hypothetical protein